MDRVRRQLGLTDAYLARLHGQTVTVAVLDSGIKQHPDLKEALFAFHDFTGQSGKAGRRYFYQTPYDDYGHGTHVCGILAGNGSLSFGRYQGICPGMRLVVGKVLDERGDGSVEEMLEGMHWVLETQSQYETRLLNLSVGIANLCSKGKEEKLRAMLEKLTDHGILVLCAAGNKGPAAGSLSFLGESDRVISVGCHDGEYFRGDPTRCASHSGRGDRNSVLRKPDIVAPGTRIKSCSGRYQKGMRTEFAYEVRSGTSMATPIVTGCLARVLQSEPGLTAKELKKLLTSTATDLGEPWNQQGWGMVCPRAMLEQVRRGSF